MTDTVTSDLIVYDQLAQTAFLERVQDVLQIFNEQSNGALVLRNEGIPGDLSKQAFYRIGGSIAHRDVTSTSTVTPSNITADERVSVKTPWKYGPYATTEEAFKRRARNIEEFYQLVGQDAADAAMSYYIECAFAGLDAAIGNNGNMNVSGAINVDHKKVLTKGMRQFGDRAQRIALFAMNSAVYFDLIDDAIDEKIFNEADVVIYGGTPGTMGKRVLVSDKIADDTIYGLQPGAVQIVESQAPGVRSYLINDKENLEIGYRMEGAFNLELLGYSWNYGGSPAAPSNPTKAQLGTGANWTQHATDDKSTAGVIIDTSTTSP